MYHQLNCSILNYLSWILKWIVFLATVFCYDTKSWRWSQSGFWAFICVDWQFLLSYVLLHFLTFLTEEFKYYLEHCRSHCLYRIKRKNWYEIRYINISPDSKTMGLCLTSICFVCGDKETWGMIVNYRLPILRIKRETAWFQYSNPIKRAAYQCRFQAAPKRKLRNVLTFCKNSIADSIIQRTLGRLIVNTDVFISGSGHDLESWCKWWGYVLLHQFWFCKCP